jgi:peroxiredoxin
MAVAYKSGSDEMTPSGHPGWMTIVLRLAGVYNLAWGALTVLYPAWLFDLTGLAEPTYPFIWQCVGMIVGVYGVGYWIAANDPARHWPIVLVGFLGKIFGPMGYVQGVLLADAPVVGAFTSPVPVEFGVTLLTNDLIWWVPFAMILWYAAKQAHATDEPAEPLERVLTETRTSGGATLLDRSRESAVLLALVRHSGCTFCKEALADLGAARERIEASGVRPVVVHMGEAGSLDPLMQQHGLSGVETVSDPDRRLYRALELPRGRFSQLFGLRVWLRGFLATLNGHMVGRLEGDGFQMPGTVVLRHGEVVARHEHRDAADRADFAGLACGVERDAGTCDIVPPEHGAPAT